MKPTSLRDIVNAVLYEGYVLYPYRPSSKKNQRQRFMFGRVYPKEHSLAQNGAEPCVMQTQCLVRTRSDSPTVNVSIGFLHPIARAIAALKTPMEEFDPADEADFEIVPELRVGHELFQTWNEAVERSVIAPPLAIATKSSHPIEVSFRFSGCVQAEPIRDEQKRVIAFIRRTQETVDGVIEASSEPLAPDLFKLTIRILNHTPMPRQGVEEDGEAVSLRTFASTHTILKAEGCEFISMIEPPDNCKDFAAACSNIGTWPVLVGDESQRQRDTILSAPIILYDYPMIAPESAGPLFDGTEIDEILTLRIMTMTEEEKFEMRRVDEQARRLLERTQTLSGDALLKMHGTMRNPRAAIEFDDFFGANTPMQGVSVNGVYVQRGDRVRIRPKARADVMDLALSGQTAMVEAVEQDLEKRVHLALVLDNDPGKDLGLMRQPGHRFFYGIDEVEPLEVQP